MQTRTCKRREEIRYSEAFKLEVVREVEAGGLAFDAISQKYGIQGSSTVSNWVRQYGQGSRGKVTRLACQRAGIGDVAEFKKKAAGQPGMKP